MINLTYLYSQITTINNKNNQKIFHLFILPQPTVGTVGRVAQSVYQLSTGWTVQGLNPSGGEIFRTCPDRPWGPLSFLYNGYRVFPGGKERPGRDADPSPPSSAVVIKEQSYISTPPTGRTACTEPQCLYKGALYLYLFYCWYHSLGSNSSFNDSSGLSEYMQRQIKGQNSE